MNDNLSRQLRATMSRLAKWRMVFAGWQLGTRPKGDPECDAVRDHREATILLRAEVTALTRLMLEKNVITQQELQAALLSECEHLDKAHEQRFPGFRATDEGMAMDVQIAKETTKNWKP